jgi:hypothetical protein
MKVYRNKDVIEAHPSKVEHYLKKGWSLEPNEAKIPAKVSPVVAATEDAPACGDSDSETSTES